MPIHRRFILALALGLVISVPALAQKPRVYDFLRNDASARSAAMGGTFLTMTGDPVAMHYNPATLYSVDSSVASFSMLKHLLDINSGFAVIGTEIDGIGHVGAAVNYVSYGSFERVDRMGVARGEFGSNDLAASIGWASELGEGFSAGVSGKLIHSNIDDYSSLALALDGGLLYVDTANRVQAGLSLLNLGSQVTTFGDVREDLPLDLKLGISHQLRGLPLWIGLNFHNLLDETDSFFQRFENFTIGGEFRISRPIRLRFGYDQQTRRDIAFGASKGLAGMSAGLGVVVAGYRFDYAFNSYARLGGLHHISISTAW